MASLHLFLKSTCCISWRRLKEETKENLPTSVFYLLDYRICTKICHQIILVWKSGLELVTAHKYTSICMHTCVASLISDSWWQGLEGGLVNGEWDRGSPETLTGDQRAQQEPGLIKNVGSIPKSDKECCKRNLQRASTGKPWCTGKRELSGHQSATVGIVLRGTIETASQPLYKDSLWRARMDSGFAGQSSHDSQWPQEVVNSGLGFREGCAGQTAVRGPTTVLASQAPGAEVWVSGKLQPLKPVLGRLHAKNFGLWPQVWCSWCFLWTTYMFFVGGKWSGFLLRTSLFQWALHSLQKPLENWLVSLTRMQDADE